MIIVIAGRPGSGKTTLAKALLKKHSDWKYIEAVTTREKRASDLPGQYEHLTDQEFDSREADGELILPVAVHGYRSAIKKKSALEMAKSVNGGLIILVPSFVASFLEATPDSVPVYILSDDATLRIRLTERGDEAETVDNKLAESAGWDAEAQASGVPYIFLENNSTIERLVSDLEAALPAQ